MTAIRHVFDRHQEAHAVREFALALIDRYGGKGDILLRPRPAVRWVYELAMFKAIAEDPHAFLDSGYAFDYRFHDWERDKKGKLLRCKATALHVWEARQDAERRAKK